MNSCYPHIQSRYPRCMRSPRPHLPRLLAWRTMSVSADPGRSPFDSLYSHGFVRVAAAVPEVRVADPKFNAERTLALARQASAERAALVVFPELGISAYSVDDLFHQEALLAGV